MKWVAAVLMILNVVVFLGISDRQIALDVRPVATRPDVNRESMLLLAEVNPASEEAPDAALELPTVVTAPDVSGLGGDGLAIPSDQDLALIAMQENQSVPDNNQDAKPGSEQGTTLNGELAASPLTRASIAPTESEDQPETAGQRPALINRSDSFCYRVGPFKDPSQWQEAREWADSEGLVYRPVRSESREMRAVRVYIGPFSSINESQADVEILKDKELDYFVYLHDNNEVRISLGYFTQEELAAKFVDYLTEQDITARSQPEYRTLGPYDWMDVDVSSASQGQILEHDWGDESVMVSERECGEV